MSSIQSLHLRFTAHHYPWVLCWLVLCSHTTERNLLLYGKVILQHEVVRMWRILWDIQGYHVLFSCYFHSFQGHSVHIQCISITSWGVLASISTWFSFISMDILCICVGFLWHVQHIPVLFEVHGHHYSGMSALSLHLRFTAHHYPWVVIETCCVPIQLNVFYFCMGKHFCFCMSDLKFKHPWPIALRFVRSPPDLAQTAR